MWNAQIIVVQFHIPITLESFGDGHGYFKIKHTFSGLNWLKAMLTRAGIVFVCVCDTIKTPVGNVSLPPCQLVCCKLTIWMGDPSQLPGTSPTLVWSLSMHPSRKLASTVNLVIKNFLQIAEMFSLKLKMQFYFTKLFSAKEIGSIKRVSKQWSYPLPK